MRAIHERLSHLVKEIGTTPTSFAKRIGKPQSSVSVILDGRSKPGFDFLEAVCTSFPNLSPDWLLTGNGTMFKTDLSSEVSVHDSKYLIEHLQTLEANFAKLTSQLEMKDQQIAGLQRTVDVLVGKSEGAIQRPLSVPMSFEELMQQYKNAVLGGLPTSPFFLAPANAKLVAPRSFV